MMKFLKLIIPNFVLKQYRARDIYKSFLFDAIRYVKFSNTFEKNNTKEKLRADIIMRYHSVEKGLTMPNRKLPFGVASLPILIEQCHQFYVKYGGDDLQVRQAVMILFEYIHIHEEHSIEVNQAIRNSIISLVEEFDIDMFTNQHKTDIATFFERRNTDFKTFSSSRFSVRDYSSKDVPQSILDEAFSLALRAPSACNRQPSRVYLVSEREKVKSVLSLQNGNRGFGHLANKVIIVTVDLSGFVGASERNLAWVDGGIFSMNLLYALHYYGVGACPLNWAVTPDKDTKLHEICEIPESQRVVLLITIGYPNEKFTHPISLRYTTEESILFR